MRFCGAVEFVLTRHMQFAWIWQIFIFGLIVWCCDGLPVAVQRLKRSPVYDDVQSYLTQYGYLPKSSSEAGNLRTEDQLQEAIRNLQAFGNIPVTGVLDDETIRLLRRPRCGIADVISSDNVRKKRYTLQGQKWSHTNLTWSLQTRQVQNLDYYRVHDTLQKAFNVWSKHSRLTFKNLQSNNADILITFERQQHGDGFPFDGRGQVLAHAFFPNSGRGGDAHFDDDEQWSVDEEENRSKGTSLFAVAAHEFGHSLGLSHSSVTGALMFPWYQGLKANFELPDDDREAIQSLYGAKIDDMYTPSRTEPPYRTPTRYVPRYTPYVPSATPATPKVPKPRPSNPNKAPDTCDTSYDAISIIRGDLFIFKDKYFWRIGDNGLYSGYPNLIERLWHQLPENFTHVDAVYERFDRKIVFFIGREVYMYNANVLISGFPKPLTALGLPSWLDHIDAAMVWGYNSKTYFFSGYLYWRFDEEIQHVELDYPRNMSIWKGIGYNIDAAFQWKDGATYFFKGKGFWKFNDPKLRVSDKRQTPSAQFWMGCPKSLEDPNVSDGIREENDVHVDDLKPDIFTEYLNITLVASLIMVLLIVIGIVIYVKKRSSHSYIRPKRINR